MRIVDGNDNERAISSYDAELYEGVYDSDDECHLTQPDTTATQINFAAVSQFITINQQKHNHPKVYSIEDLSHGVRTFSVLKMRMNLNKQQMDSGANKNVTDDKTIIRNYSPITPIAVFGIEKDEVACQIVGKGLTELTTVDGDTLPITMYFAPQCAGTIISPNAIVQNSKQFTGWQQTSHVDTGKADIVFFHRHDTTNNRRLRMILSNDLWFIHQPYANIVNAANRTNICLLREFNDPQYIQIHTLNKTTEYELWHQRLMHAGNTCFENLQ